MILQISSESFRFENEFIYTFKRDVVYIIHVLFVVDPNKPLFHINKPGV